MMNRQTLAIGLVVVLGLGTWLAFEQGVFGPEPVKNAEMLQTENETRIVTEADVEYFPGARGYFARPFDAAQGEPEAKGKYPGVVMIHENRGLRPEIRQTAEQLAKEGYLVLAVDLLGGVAEDQTGARALTSKFNQEAGVANMRAAAAYLRAQGAGKIASLGWCFGGRQSIELAISGEKLSATVVYYGGGMATTTERLAPIAWPVLGIFGDKDQAIPVETVRAFETSLNMLGVNNEIHIYPGVGHAFANPSGMSYAPEETKDAWNKTVAFLKKHL
jgi:carboxymethylenebutenolidase